MDPQDDGQKMLPDISRCEIRPDGLHTFLSIPTSTSALWALGDFEIISQVAIAGGGSVVKPSAFVLNLLHDESFPVDFVVIQWTTLIDKMNVFGKRFWRRADAAPFLQ